MAITVWPVDAVGTAPNLEPVYSGRKLRQTSVSAFGAMGTPTRPLGVRSGVRPGTRGYTGSVSGMTWSMGAHTGILDVESAAEAGAYAYAVDATVTGAITAANATNPRADLVCAQLSDPAEGDGTAVPKVEILYIAGTPSATPVTPATPVRSIPLMRITVPAAGGGNPTAGWMAPYTAAAGAYVPFLTLAELNTWTTAPLQQHASVTGDVASRNGDYQFDGTSWVAQSPSGVDSNGWTWVTLSNGKRMFTRHFVDWAGANFGPQGGSNWSQIRQSGILPPTGLAWDAVSVDVSVYPRTAANGLQFLIVGFLTQSTGTGAAVLTFVNPTAATIVNTSMDLKSVIMLIEK